MTVTRTRNLSRELAEFVREHNVWLTAEEKLAVLRAAAVLRHVADAEARQIEAEKVA